MSIINGSSAANDEWRDAVTPNEWNNFYKTQPKLFSFLKYNGMDGEYRNYNNWRGVSTAAGLYYHFGEIKCKYGSTSDYPNMGVIESITINGTTYNSSNNKTVTANNLFKLNDKISRIRSLTIEEVNNILGRSHYSTSLVDKVYNDTSISADDKRYQTSLLKLSLIQNLPNMSSYSNYGTNKAYFLASPAQSVSSIYNLDSLGTISTPITKQGNFSTYGLRPVIEFKSSSAKFDWSSSNNCWIMSE